MDEEIMEVENRGSIRSYTKLPYDENRNCRMVLIETDFNNLTTKTWHLQPAPDMPTTDSWKRRYLERFNTSKGVIENLQLENRNKTERIKQLESIVANMTCEYDKLSIKFNLQLDKISHLKNAISKARCALIGDKFE